jgi:hypothetical protein
MARNINADLDFLSANKIINLPQATAPGDAVEFSQVLALVEGISWKSSVRAASTVDITLSAPGSTIGGVTMSANDRFLAKDQSTGSQNGIFVWNGAASPATRALDASTFRELEGAVVKVEEGTNAGTQWRQTSVNGTIDSSNIVWVSDATAVPAASETVAGTAEIATQAETDTGTDDQRFITPLKQANWSGRAKRYAVTFGDGSSTSYTITHNLGTLDVNATVYLVSSGAEVICDVVHATTNTLTVGYKPAPASNSLRIVVLA